MAITRFIIVALGSAGDVHPNVGLALELQRRGCEVLFVSSEPFRALAENAGLGFIGLGSKDEYEAAIRDPDLWHPTRSFPLVAQRLILPAMRPVYQIIERSAGVQPTVVAASGFAFGARIAQERLSVPLATVHLQPIMFRSAVRPGCFGFPDLLGALPPSLRKLYFRAADALLLDKWLAKDVNSFREELGLAPVSRFLDRWFYSPTAVIGLFPSWFASPQPDWPANVTLTGFPLWDEKQLRPASPDLEAFLQGGEPPVVFTAGSAMLHAEKFFETSVDICAAGQFRGLLLTQYRDQIPDKLPTNVRHFDYVPFSSLLPRCAALVHHGGIGTAAQAIAAGIPQLIVPYAHDQPDNAIRVRALGIGEYVLPSRYSKDKAVQLLLGVLTSKVKEKCRSISKKVEGNSLSQAASLLIQLAPTNGFA